MNNHCFDKELDDLLKLFDKYSVSRNDLITLILALKYDHLSLPIPESLHLRLLELYCKSSGLVQETIHRLRLGSRKHLSFHPILASSRFSISANQFTEIIHQVVNHGYATLPFSLSQSDIQTILSKSYRFPSYECVYSNGTRSPCFDNNYLFSKDYKLVAAYANEDDLLTDPKIHSIIHDPLLISIFSFLLGSKAQLRHVSLWHSFPNAEPSAEAAQLFHFDLDEFKWFKLFIFLTDVDEQSGPHVYIPGTHRVGRKPLDLLKYGYTRISDDVMSSFYPKSSWRKLTCNSGTMVIANTSCWHKGTHVISRTRSVLQPEYSLSTFSKNLS